MTTRRGPTPAPTGVDANTRPSATRTHSTGTSSGYSASQRRAARLWVDYERGIRDRRDRFKRVSDLERRVAELERLQRREQVR